MFRLVNSSVAGTSVTAGAQRRCFTKLHTSYHSGYLNLNALTGSTPTVPRKGKLFRSALRSPRVVVNSGPWLSKQLTSSAAATGGAAAKEAAAAATEAPVEGVDFEKAAAEADVADGAQQKTVTKKSKRQSQATHRPYIPLAEAARIELQGDYLMEGGQPRDALRCYGVVAKLFKVAYAGDDNKCAGIAIKLSRAFRLCGLEASAVANAESALAILNVNAAPHIDLCCEALIEYGEALLSTRKPRAAGVAFEDVANIIDNFHCIGNAQRVIRVLPKLGVRMSVNHDKKFIYASKFGSDRVLHLGDHALGRAEAAYRICKRQKDVVRVIERRTALINTAIFEGQDVAGRIRTLRGYAGRHPHSQVGGATPRELLLFSPTIHQTYFDRSQGVAAPLGQEDEVMAGANRRVIDDGHYGRLTKRLGRGMVRGVANDAGGVNSMSSIYDY